MVRSVRRLQRARQSAAFSKGGQGAFVALTVTMAPVQARGQLSRYWRKHAVRGRGLAYWTEMSQAAPSLRGIVHSGTPPIPPCLPPPGPDPASPAPHRGLRGSPGARDGKSHTEALSDTHTFAQAYVNHTKTDKFSY